MGAILKNKVRIARKCHICDLCGSKIEANEPYHYMAFVEDGELFTQKEHPECHEAAELAISEYYGPSDEITFSNVQEAIVEMCRERMGDIQGIPIKELARRLYMHEMGASILEQASEAV